MIGGRRETFIAPKDHGRDESKLLQATEATPTTKDIDLVAAFEKMLSETTLTPDERQVFENAGARWAGALYRLLNDPAQKASERFSPELIAVGREALKNLGIGDLGVSVLAAVAKQAREKTIAEYEAKLNIASDRIAELEDRLKERGE